MHLSEKYSDLSLRVTICSNSDNWEMIKGISSSSHSWPGLYGVRYKDYIVKPSPLISLHCVGVNKNNLSYNRTSVHIWSRDRYFTISRTGTKTRGGGGGAAGAVWRLVVNRVFNNSLSFKALNIQMLNIGIKLSTWGWWRKTQICVGSIYS